MLFAALSLLLASLSLTSAGLLQRQCYPETVYITASEDPSIITTTCTETLLITSTKVVTAYHRPPTTMTTTTTETMIIQGPTVTLTQTLEGLTFSSSAYSVTVMSHDFASIVSTTCSGGVGDCEQSLPVDPDSLSKHRTAVPFATSTAISTVIVLPLATKPPSHLPADENTSTVLSDIPAATSTSASISLPRVATSTGTVTVDVTRTILMTSVVNPLSALPPFPTLNVTGTMGFNPQGANGTTGAFGTATGSETVSTSGTAGGLSGAQSKTQLLTFGPLGSAPWNLSITLGPTVESSQASVPTLVSLANSTPGNDSLTTLDSVVLPSGTNFSATSSVSSTSFVASNIATLVTAAGNVSSTIGSSISLASTAAETSFSFSTAFTLSNTSAINTFPLSSRTAATGFSFSPSQLPSFAPFANSSSTKAGSTGILPSSSAIPSVIGTASTTAPLSRRCGNENPFDWLDKLKRQEAPIIETLPDGQVVTLPWGVSEEKRQVGGMVTATINGNVVTWVNDWDGVGTPSLETVLQPIQTSPGSAESLKPAFTSTISLFAKSTEAATSVSTTMLIVPVESGVIPLDITVTSLVAPLPSSEVQSAAPKIPFVTSITVPVSQSQTSMSVEESTRLLNTLASDHTGLFPSYTPPAWLTSLVPVAPTTAVDLGTVRSETVDGQATACVGPNSGPFVIDFEDLPHSAQPDSTDQFPPLQNPYHKLVWSQGFSYAPPPLDPYSPHSGKQLGIFIVDGNANIHSQNWTGPIPQGDEVNGMFGAGPNYQDPRFYFDATGAWLGCQNSGPDDCDILVNGYGYDEITGKSVVQAEQHFYQAPCPRDCSLQHFTFSPAFRNLTALQIQASHEGDASHTALTWYIDDLALVWTDNSCDAVEARNS